MHFNLVNSNHPIEILLFQIDKDLLQHKDLEITILAMVEIVMITVETASVVTASPKMVLAVTMVAAMAVIVTVAVAMVAVMEMVVMAVAKGLINVKSIKMFNIQRKPSSQSMRVYFMAFTTKIYFFSRTKNKATAPITGAIARVINADL